MKLPFKINHIDPLGQGVSREKSQVIFIPKTLPGEEGLTQIINKKKGVQFGIVEKDQDFIKTSELRIPAVCPHFKECPSCHFLHTSYSQEIEFKKKSLEHILGRAKHRRPELIMDPLLRVIPAKERFSYRNRVQLHYDLKSKKLGYLNLLLGKIVEVPHCLLPEPKIQESLQEFYKNDRWINEVKESGLPSSGHLEIYLHREKNSEEPILKISWNKPYAFGGFSQINEGMNQILRNEVYKFYQQLPESLSQQTSSLLPILDFFGGDGNLTHLFSREKVFVIDASVHQGTLLSHQEGLECNLYDKHAPDLLKKKIGKKKIKILLLDPPRSGLKNLNQFLQIFSPSYIFYISCNPQTLFRDLLEIKEEYLLDEIVLLDLFPSTYHFETMVSLSKKNYPIE